MISNDSIRVLLCCTGVGICNRGIESFFREAFDALKGKSGLELRLIKGGGQATCNEKVAWCLPRDGAFARIVGRITGRNAYVAEQWTSFPSVVREIRSWRPHVVYYSDSNLGFLLFRFRRQIGVRFQLLFSNGAPCSPPFARTDFVHQVAPYYFQEAVLARENTERHFMVPYGIRVPDPPETDPGSKRSMKAHLGLPLDRPIALSVGWIASQHKRMDYTIREIAQLTEPRPFLQLLGAMDSASGEILELGNRLLGARGFAATSVPYHQVGDYYRAADFFVLSSLKEGFGRVYLEALMNGLPTIGHCHPVIEYVLGSSGIIADLSRPGGLSSTISDRILGDLPSVAGSAPARSRWKSVRERFSWNVLGGTYRQMFINVANRS